MKWLLILIAVVVLARIVAQLLRQQRSEQDGSASRAGTLTPDPVPVDYADALAHAVAEGEAKLEKEGERLIAARLHFGWDSEGPDAAAAFAALVEGERGQTLERLTLGIFQADDNDYGPVFAALAAGPELPRLRELFIGDYEYPDETEISWTSVGDFGPLWSKLPALESLRLRGGGIALGNAAHDNLRSMTLETGGLPDAAVRSLATGRFPRLEKLEIWLGTDDYGGDSSIETLMPLLHSQGYPALRHLGLRNAEYTDAIAEAVLGAPLLSQLETIDLSMGMLSDDGAAALTAAADRLRHLRKLNVTDNYVGESAAAALQSSLGAQVEVGTQKEPDVYDDETYRYVTVGE